MPNANESYNGWQNYETWNVALWIGNDKGLYNLAKESRRAASPYADFRQAMLELGGGEIAHQTPDGVSWNDSGLDTEALDKMIREL